MALVTDNSLLKIHHIYRDVIIDLPLLAHIGVFPAHLPGPTFTFSYKQCELELLKIQITKTPYMEQGNKH
jgi:hypothetical protein